MNLQLRSIILRLGIIFLILGNLACGSRAFRAASPNNSALNSTCPAKSTYFSENKIQISEASLVQSKAAKGAVRTFSAVISHGCQFAKALNDFNFSERYIFEEIAMIGSSDENTYPISVSSADIGLLIEAAQRDKCVVGISESVPMKLTFVPNDARLAEEKHLPAINAQEGWGIFYSAQTGIQKDIIIAVIDSGIDMLHEDLKDQLWTNSKEVPNNRIDDDGNGLVDDYYGYNFADDIASPAHSADWQGWYHGTHVAGLAAARMNNNVGISGIMGRNVKIMALNVFGKSEGTTPTFIDRAIRYAADNGAHIINMSLGGKGRVTSTAAAIQYAIGKGSVVVTAAGNDNADIAQEFFTPASFAPEIAGLVSVGSTDAVTKGKSSFSNHNPNMVEIGAPGSNGLLSTTPNQTYNLLQGTSMSAPVVAGAAGLIFNLAWSRKGTVPSPAEVESILTNSADSLAPLRNYFSMGRHLNLFSAAKMVDTLYPISAPGSVPNPGNTNCQSK